MSKTVKAKNIFKKNKAKKSVKRVSVKKVNRLKKTLGKAAHSKKPAEKVISAKKPVGKVTHFYDQIGVAVVALNSALKVDDKIRIGREERFLEQEVKSMQIEHQKIQTAKKGQEIGLKVRKRVRENDLVYKF